MATPHGQWLLKLLRAHPRGKSLSDEAAAAANLVEAVLPDIEAEAIAADSLDAALAEVEAALPKGWHLCAVERHCHVGDATPGEWGAYAHDANRWESESAQGPTPAAALRALTVKLRETA